MYEEPKPEWKWGDLEPTEKPPVVEPGDTSAAQRILWGRLVPMALGVHEAEMTSGSDAKVRLASAESVLDRAGISRKVQSAGNVLQINFPAEHLQSALGGLKEMFGGAEEGSSDERDVSPEASEEAEEQDVYG